MGADRIKKNSSSFRSNGRKNAPKTSLSFPDELFKANVENLIPTPIAPDNFLITIREALNR